MGVAHWSQARDEATSAWESRAAADRPRRATDKSREQQCERPTHPRRSLTCHLQARAARVPGTHARGLGRPPAPLPATRPPPTSRRPQLGRPAPSCPRGTGAPCPSIKKLVTAQAGRAPSDAPSLVHPNGSPIARGSTCMHTWAVARGPPKHMHMRTRPDDTTLQVQRADRPAAADANDTRSRAIVCSCTGRRASASPRGATRPAPAGLQV